MTNAELELELELELECHSYSLMPHARIVLIIAAETRLFAWHGAWQLLQSTV